MLNRRQNTISIVIAATVLIIAFTLIGFVILSVVLSNNLIPGNNTTLSIPTPDVLPNTADLQVGTPSPLGMSIYRDTTLGFEVEYPLAWQKKQTGLEIIFSPSVAGLEADDLQEPVIRFGIPADDSTDVTQILSQLQADLFPNSRVLDTSSITIGAQPWQMAKLELSLEQFSGIATIAATNRDGVGYYAIVQTPAHQWDTLESRYQSMLDSFRFTSQTVLRPTDATPPPTPTPTPTPVFYIVQSGDTFGKIALQYDVEIEALMARNGYDDARVLRTGSKLIIPIKRR